MVHYFVYKTTNLINGKFYIGKHATSDLNDGYMGSGLALRRAFLKYGRENFVTQIVAEAECEESLNALERNIVTQGLCSDPNSYNIALGGQGGCIVLKPDHPLYAATVAKLALANKARGAATSLRMKALHAEGKAGMAGKKHSSSTKLKISETAKTVDRAWLTGRVLSAESRAKCTGRPKGIVSDKSKAQVSKLHSADHQCEHCGMMNIASNHKRWHGDKCKHKV